MMRSTDDTTRSIDLLVTSIVEGTYPRPRSLKRNPTATTHVALISSITGVADTGEQVEALCQTLADLTSSIVDWSTYCGRYAIKADAEHQAAVVACMRELVPLVAAALPPCDYGGHRVQAMWLTVDGVLDKPIDNIDRRSASEIADDHMTIVATQSPERQAEWRQSLQAIDVTNDSE